MLSMLLLQLSIDHTIIPAAPANEDAVAAYAAFTAGSRADRLLSASCTCAERIELHRVVRKDGQVDMIDDFPLALPKRTRVEVKPGSDLHFMLIGTRRAFVSGERVTMTLTFARAGRRDISFRVVPTSASGWTEWRAEP